LLIQSLDKAGNKVEADERRHPVGDGYVISYAEIEVRRDHGLHEQNQRLRE
jgi:hypothetical protein